MRQTRGLPVTAPRKNTAVGWTILVILAAPCVVDAEPPDDLSLEIALRAPRAELTQGEMLELWLYFSNTGEEPFFVERPVDLGTNGVTVIARRQHCEYRSSPAHFDRPLSALRFQYIPLMQDDEFGMILPPLNEPASGLSLPLPIPGTYQLQAEFNSDGSDHEGLIWPIWRGRAVSNALEVSVAPPSESQRRDWLEDLEDCVMERECDPLEILEAIQPFQMGYIPGAAPLLRELIRSDPERNAIAASALALQGDSSDEELLKTLALVVADARTHEYLLDMAENLRGEDVCWRTGGAAPSTRDD